MSVRLYSLLNYLVCKGIHHIIICGHSSSKKVSHFVINSTIFGEKKKLLNIKCVF